MPLAPGTRLGPYEVVAPAGAGGMGEVYRATDSALKRTVAIKVLPEAVAGDPERLARFQREAEVLAALHHPNITGIFGLESAGSVKALVMEFVEGPTLAERIAQGPLPPDEAIPIARQIAEALESAHELGIVHRDLKPANVKVRADGTVKVLDFGLAKSVLPGAGSATGATPAPGSAAAHAATITSPAMTMMGVVLGTAAYMAPEQARGRAVDRRADIWAFGCVLYEMLTGRQAFAGDDTTEVIAAIVTREPDLAVLPAQTPPAVRALLARCFVKDPKQRLRDIGEARLTLERPDAPGHGQSVKASKRPARWPLVALAAALAIATLGWIVAAMQRPGTKDGIAPGTRLAITFPAGADLQKGQPLPSLAFSPDGRTIVYTAVGPEGNQLWVRRLDQFEPTPVPGTGNARMAFFSPDGRWIGFLARSRVWKMPVTLGPASEVCVTEGYMQGATWTDRDEIVYGALTGSGGGLWRVPARGGEPRPVARGSLAYPDALPGGRAVIATSRSSATAETSGDLTIVAVSLEDGKVTKLFDGGTFGRWVPGGFIAFLRGGAIMAAPFDPAKLAVGEARVAVVPDAFMDPSTPSGNFAVSASGALAYVPGAPEDLERALVVIDPAPGAGPPRPLIESRRQYAGARISPDGRLLAAPTRAWRDRIWIVELERQTFSRLTSTEFLTERSPVWSPDGRSLAFRADQENGSNGVFRVPAEGTAPAETLYAGPEELTPDSWTRDEKSLVVTVSRNDRSFDLKLLTPPQAPGQAPELRPLLVTDFSESGGQISPDGTTIAYQSDRSGKNEVYVAAFPSMEPTIRVSIEGGSTPVWKPNSRTLYFRAAGNKVMKWEMPATSPPGTTAGTRPTTLTTYPQVIPTGFVEPLPDGRLIALDGRNVSATPELRVVFGWGEEVRGKVR